MHAIFWLESLRGVDHLDDLGVVGRIISRWVLGKQSGSLRSGFLWLRIEINGGPL